MNAATASPSLANTVSYDASAALSLTAKAAQQLSNAHGYIIDSPVMYQLASDDLKQIKALQKEVEEKRTSITGPLTAAVKAVNDLFRGPKEYLDKAEATLKRSMVAWTTEQERLAAEARAQAEAAARIERERLAAEARAQAQAAALAQAQAQAAEAAGDQAAAQRAMAAAQEAQAQADIAELTSNVISIVPAIESPAKVSGISGRITYAASVTDLMTLVKAVAAGLAPIECLQADTKFLSAQARAFKKTGALYPGVESIAERSISARAA